MAEKVDTLPEYAELVGWAAELTTRLKALEELTRRHEEQVKKLTRLVELHQPRKEGKP